MGNQKSVSTAKLIFQDGTIQVYSSPVKVSHILDENPAWFICNADHMEFDDFVRAVDDDYELRMGHLYFALPLSWLDQPLQAEDMAALAVKATPAFPSSHGGGGENRGCCFSRPRVDDYHQGPWVHSGEEYVESRRKFEAVGGDSGEGGGLGQEESGRRRSSGHGRKLSMIPEDQSSFEMPSL